MFTIAKWKAKQYARLFVLSVINSAYHVKWRAKLYARRLLVPYLSDISVKNNHYIYIMLKPKGIYNFYVYIITNKAKTVLYTGVTNNLKRRL